MFVFITYIPLITFKQNTANTQDDLIVVLWVLVVALYIWVFPLKSQ